MKKWAPYKSLNEQWDVLEKMSEEEYVEKPTISNEEAEEINEKLVNYEGQEYTFYHYKRGKVLKEKTTIKKIDVFNHKLIFNNGVSISLKDLVGIK